MTDSKPRLFDDWQCVHELFRPCSGRGAVLPVQSCVLPVIHTVVTLMIFLQQFFHGSRATRATSCERNSIPRLQEFVSAVAQSESLPARAASRKEHFQSWLPPIQPVVAPRCRKRFGQFSACQLRNRSWESSEMACLRRHPGSSSCQVCQHQTCDLVPSTNTSAVHRNAKCPRRTKRKSVANHAFRQRHASGSDTLCQQYLEWCQP